MRVVCGKRKSGYKVPLRTHGATKYIPTRNVDMTKDELSSWALANGWQLIDGHPSLTKPSAPGTAIVRLVLKTTVANLEIKKPAGKWEKVSSAPYSKIEPDSESGNPSELGLDTISGITALMRDNKDRLVFAKMGASKS